MKKSTKQEIIYLILALSVISLLVWVSNYLPTFNFLSGLNPIAQFLILNLGLYFVFFFLIKFIVLKKKHSFVGALGAIISFIAIDLILPDYHVTTHGLIVGSVFGASASDYFFGWIYQGLGVPAVYLPFLVYVVTFAVLFILGAVLIKNFVKLMTQ